MKKTLTLSLLLFAFSTIIYAQTWSSASLSEARGDCAVGVIDKKLIVAGGGTNYISLTIGKSSRVDIYDDMTGKWTVSNLSSARFNPTSVIVGKKMYIIGGQEGESNLPSNKYDVYDAASNTWSNDTMPIKPLNPCVAYSNNKILFAGSETLEQYPSIVKNTVRIWDIITNKWTSDTLSVARGNIKSVNLGNKIFFIGGTEAYFPFGPNDITYSNAVDIYDADKSTWAKAKLSSPRFYPLVTVVGKKIIIVGGIERISNGMAIFSKKIDIYDSETNTWAVSEAPEPRGGAGAISWEDNAYFIWGMSSGSSGSFVYPKINIFNPINTTWKELVAPTSTTPRATQVAAINNKIFIIGGTKDLIPTNKVDIITFPTSSISEKNLLNLNLSAFPNPTTSILNVRFNSEYTSKCQLSISNINGQIVKNDNFNISKGENMFEIDSRDIPKGVYFLTIKTDKSLGSNVFVKD